MSLVIQWAEEGLSREEIQKRIQDIREGKRDEFTGEIKSVSSTPVSSGFNDITTRPGTTFNTPSAPSYTQPVQEQPITPAPQKPGFFDSISNFKDTIDESISTGLESIDMYKDKDQLTAKNIGLDALQTVGELGEAMFNSYDTVKGIGNLVYGGIEKAGGLETERTQALDNIYTRGVKPLVDAGKYTAAGILPDNLTPDEWKLASNENFRKQVQNNPVEVLTNLLTGVKGAAKVGQLGAKVGKVGSSAVGANKIAKAFGTLEKKADLLTNNRYINTLADADSKLASAALNLPGKAVEAVAGRMSGLSRNSASQIVSNKKELDTVMKEDNYLENKIKEQQGNIQSKLTSARDTFESQKTDEVLMTGDERRKAVLDYARSEPTLQLDITPKTTQAEIDAQFKNLSEKDSKFKAQIDELTGQELANRLDLNRTTALQQQLSNIAGKTKSAVAGIPEVKKAQPVAPDIDTKGISSRIRKQLSEAEAESANQKKVEYKDLNSQLKDIDKTIVETKKTGVKEIDDLNSQKLQELKGLKSELNTLYRTTKDQNSAQFKQEKQRITDEFIQKKNDIESTYKGKLQEQTSAVSKLGDIRTRAQNLVSTFEVKDKSNKNEVIAKNQSIDREIGKLQDELKNINMQRYSMKTNFKKDDLNLEGDSEYKRIQDQYNGRIEALKEIKKANSGVKTDVSKLEGISGRISTLLKDIKEPNKPKTDKSLNTEANSLLRKVERQLDQKKIKNLEDTPKDVLDTNKVSTEVTPEEKIMKQMPSVKDKPKDVIDTNKISDTKVNHMKLDILNKEKKDIEKRLNIYKSDKTIDKNSSIIKNLETELQNKNDEINSYSLEDRLNNQKLRELNIEKKEIEDYLLKYKTSEKSGDYNIINKEYDLGKINNKIDIITSPKVNLSKSEKDLKQKRLNELQNKFNNEYNRIKKIDDKVLSDNGGVFPKGYEAKSLGSDWIGSFLPMKEMIELDRLKQEGYIYKKIKGDTSFNLASDIVTNKIEKFKSEYTTSKEIDNKQDLYSKKIDVERWNKEEFDGKSPRFGSRSGQHGYINYNKGKEIVKKYLNENEYEVVPTELKVGGFVNKERGVLALRNGKVGIGTPEHEVVHAYIGRFVKPERIDSILDEIIKSKNITQAEVDAYNKHLQKVVDPKIYSERTIKNYAEEALSDGFLYYLESGKGLKGFTNKIIEFFKEIIGKADKSEVKQFYKDIVDLKRETDTKPGLTLTRHINKLKKSISERDINDPMRAQLASYMQIAEKDINKLASNGKTKFDDITTKFNLEDDLQGIDDLIKMQESILKKTKDKDEIAELQDVLKELNAEKDKLLNKAPEEKIKKQIPSVKEKPVAKPVVKEEVAQPNLISKKEKLLKAREELKKLTNKETRPQPILSSERPIETFLKEIKSRKVEKMELPETKKDIQSSINKELQSYVKTKLTEKSETAKQTKAELEKKANAIAEQILNLSSSKLKIEESKAPVLPQDVPLNQRNLGKLKSEIKGNVLSEKESLVKAIEKELNDSISQAKNKEVDVTDIAESRKKELNDKYKKDIEEKKLVYKDTLDSLNSDRRDIREKIVNLGKQKYTPEIEAKIKKLKNQENVLKELDGLVKQFNNKAKPVQAKLPTESGIDTVIKGLSGKQKAISEELKMIQSKSKSLETEKKNVSKEADKIKNKDIELDFKNLESRGDKDKAKETARQITNLFNSKFDNDKYTKKDFFVNIQTIEDSDPAVFVKWKNYIKNDPIIKERFPEATKYFEEYAKMNEFKEYFNLNTVKFKKERNAENDKRFKQIFRELAGDKEADKLEKQLELESVKRDIKGMDERTDSSWARAFGADKGGLKVLEMLGDYNSSIAGKTHDLIKKLIIKSAPVLRPTYQQIQEEEKDKKKKKSDKENISNNEKLKKQIREILDKYNIK